MSIKKRYKETLIVSLPIIFTHFVDLLVPFINTYLAAQINIDSLAALAIVNSTYMSFMGFCWGLVTSVGIVTSQRIGANNFKNIGLILKSGFILSIVVSIIGMIYFANCKPIWVYLGQNENVASLAQIGLNGFLIGVVPDILKYAAFHYCISFGKTKIPMIANIVTLPLIYLVNTILAFGGYGFPEMGIYGLGIGTSFVDWIILILMIFYIYSHKELGKYLRIKNKLLEYKELILALFKLGAPIGLMFSIEISFFMAFSIMIGIISEDALAAYQISHQWVFTVVIIAYGLAEAVIILVGRAFGAKDLKLAQTYSFICIIISATVVSFASIFYWLIPDAFIGFDIDLSEKSNLSMVNFARSFLVFGGIFQIIDSIRIIISGSLRGMNYTQYPMWVTLITYWIIGFPLSYLLAFHFKMGVNGLWIGLIICASLNALFQYHKLHRVFFKKSSL